MIASKHASMQLKCKLDSRYAVRIAHHFTKWKDLHALHLPPSRLHKRRA